MQSSGPGGNTAMKPIKKQLRAAGSISDGQEVIAGLQRTQKQIPSKFLYDPRGSKLFDRICELPEYYLTRTEIGILEEHSKAIAEALGERCAVIELGSGNSRKARILLDALPSPAAYVPVDISGEYLLAEAKVLEKDYPALTIAPLNCDYMRDMELPQLPPHRRRIVFFPGSTIGNLRPREARALLRKMARLAGNGGALLIGVDTKKDERTIEAAYNDSQGVTAEFNLNILSHLNRLMRAGFNPALWRHCAFYQRRTGRVEMHLISKVEQLLKVEQSEMPCLAGESIRTELSYKYAPWEFAELARGISEHGATWTDPRCFFSVHLFKVP